MIRNFFILDLNLSCLNQIKRLPKLKKKVFDTVYVLVKFNLMQFSSFSKFISNSFSDSVLKA